MEKNLLPIKTKIAAWWMIIYVILLSFLIAMKVIWLILLAGALAATNIPPGFDLLFLLFLFLLLNSFVWIGILKKKKLAWWATLILFPIIFILIFKAYTMFKEITLFDLVLNLILLTIPLILLSPRSQKISGKLLVKIFILWKKILCFR
jgi:hypothetical protein